MNIDDPALDGTDNAHPAWWRGNDAGVVALCQQINEILDGKDDGAGVANEPWESTRRRLVGLRVENAILRAGIEAVQDLIDDSEGVCGLHRNGHTAPWSELLAGGRFEHWLAAFSTAIEMANHD